MGLNIRKLQSAEEIEKKKKRNMLIASIVLIAILVFSTAGYFSSDSDNGNTKNNKNISEIGNEWVLDYGGQYLRFSNPPEVAENVSMNFNYLIDDYSGKVAYVASDSDSASYEIGASLGRYTQRMQGACYGKCDKDFPEKNCTDYIIVFSKSNETSRVYQEQNCIFIEGDLKAVDAFLYRVFGVI
jgi:hypothetical protein